MTTSVGRVGVFGRVAEVGVAGATLGWQQKKLVSFRTGRGFLEWRSGQSALPLVASRLVFGFGSFLVF